MPVAPLAGSVDRNLMLATAFRIYCLVAPLAGSVDRNGLTGVRWDESVRSLPSRGAWIEIFRPIMNQDNYTSLPSRGAWIEIPLCFVLCGPFGVAPLAGSVDRNPSLSRTMIPDAWSLPSRGAWIEMALQAARLSGFLVAPLAGSVDRNGHDTHGAFRCSGRSPRGERG